jgi:hypothetical protein
MSKPGEAPNSNRVIELKAAAHLMSLDAGVFCVYHAPNQPSAGSDGLPGVRISEAPGAAAGNVSIRTFADDGWIGATGGAALIRVMRGPAQVLVTTYQASASVSESPRLQVVQLAGAAAPAPAVAAAASRPVQAAVAPPPAPTPAPVEASATAAGQPAALPGKAEIAAHIQRRGDVLSRIGEWMGTPGSQFWIEGFGIAPNGGIPVEDIEYQAVLGKGWLSPWAEGGQYCGSRGMALPILGLRVRLKGESAKTHACRLTATFTDGTKVGPIDDSMAAEAESLAPLEAFLIEIVPAESAVAPKTGRGRKPALAAPVAAAPVTAPSAEAAPRRRGRPPKAASPAPAAKAVSAKAPSAKTASAKPAPKAAPARTPVAKAASRIPAKAAPKRRGSAKR